MAVKIIDKTQLNSSSLQKVSSGFELVLIMHVKQRTLSSISVARLHLVILDPRSLELLSFILEMLDFDFAQG